MSSPKGRTAQTNLSSMEIADRLANRELNDAYAYCADRQDKGHAARVAVHFRSSDLDFLVIGADWR